MRNVKQIISHKDLLQVLAYDPTTGVFTWKTTLSSRAVAGQKAGSLLNKKYWHIELGGRRYQAHRLAWFYVNKLWPEVLIDHINRDPGDNRYANLREATHSQNSQNRAMTLRNTSGFIGVSWHKKGRCWNSSITINRKKIYLGGFATPSEANAAYMAAKQAHHSFALEAQV